MINRMSGQLYLVTSGTTTVHQVLQICIQAGFAFVIILSMLNRCLHRYKCPLHPFTLATCTGWMDVWLTPPDWDCAVHTNNECLSIGEQVTKASGHHFRFNSDVLRLTGMAVKKRGSGTIDRKWGQMAYQYSMIALVAHKPSTTTCIILLFNFGGQIKVAMSGSPFQNWVNVGYVSHC